MTEHREAYTIHPIGGCQWAVYRGEEFLCIVDAGEIDENGDWQGDEGEVLDAALDDVRGIKDDGLPVIVDGVRVR
jgi:hypothetical protein